MKKALIIAFCLALAPVLAGCNSKSCPPATFIPQEMKQVEATERPPERAVYFFVPKGWDKTKIWRKVVAAYQPEYFSDVVNLEKGLISTSWRYFTYDASQGFNGGYRVKLVIRMKGDDWRQIEISSPATWRENMEDPATARPGNDSLAMDQYLLKLKAEFAKKCEGC